MVKQVAVEEMEWRENMAREFANPTTPQPIGSAELTGDNGSYYDITINGNIVSCNDVIDALGLSFNHGELFKAAWRMGRKPTVPASYDLDKILYFAKRMGSK